jgi:fructose-1,6-bisphosphatase II / sedoheptulose-1,7-bisphosphatase
MAQVLSMRQIRTSSSVDICMSTGGAPEGVPAAAALRGIGGHMHADCCSIPIEKRERAAGMGISNSQKIFLIEDMVRGDSYAATGVTDGTLVSGVKFRKHFIETEIIVMRSVTGTVRIIRGQHRQLEKIHLD